MEETNEFSIQTGTYGRGSRRRKQLFGAAVAAVVAMLIVIVLAARAGTDEPGAPFAVAATTPVETTAEPADAPQVQKAGGSASGSNGGGGSNDEQPQQPEPEQPEPEEPEPAEPPEPLNIEAAIDTLTPGGQCFASATIAVTGGEYPLTVHYQWRALVVAGGWDGEPVSPVHNVTFTEPGETSVQTNALPEDGTNVFLVISGPQDGGSGLAAYDGCSDAPGDITLGD